MRSTLGVLAVAVVALLGTGCGGRAVASHPAGHTPGPSVTAGVRLAGGGTLAPPAPRAAAIVYDTALVPAGAAVRVTAESGAVLAASTVTVSGMLPHRTYGVHLHVNPCGRTPDDAGPHYRQSHSHTHASAETEVWLDVTTDAGGGGTATATQDWAFQPGRPPRSLVIHAEPTRTSGAEAGSAGPRVACVTLTER
ncbi:hypothetical protein GCM10010517_40440 [Streptosporangium fragile]|uniref:Superoxide dismutase copper/zinc binding domain-containing protein n=1 Tax=Streptosporangium fragile TaxID=46186 RepID=A0ABN3W0B1_9ACTN